MEVRNKAKFFELWEAGVLGNRTRLWRDVEQCVHDARQLGIKEIGFRQVGKTGGGAWQKAPLDEVYKIATEWTNLGRKFIMDDGAPDQYRTIQGELCRTFKGLEGYIEIGGRMPMRQAMNAGLMKQYSYAATNNLLNKYMDPSSRDDVDSILELFPDAAIEFTCFSVNVGIFPGRNTLFWETRNY